MWFAGCDQSNDDTITSYEHVKECTQTQKDNELKGSFFSGPVNSRCIGVRLEGIIEKDLEYVFDTYEGKDRGCRQSTKTLRKVICRVAEKDQEFCRWIRDNRDLLCAVDL